MRRAAWPHARLPKPAQTQEPDKKAERSGNLRTYSADPSPKSMAAAPLSTATGSAGPDGVARAQPARCDRQLPRRAKCARGNVRTPA